MVTRWQLYSCQWDACSWLYWRAFIREILQIGLLADRANDRGQTPADNMIELFDLPDGYRCARERQGTIDICSDLLNSGGFMTHMALDCRHQPFWYDPFYHYNRGDGRMNNHIFEDNSIRLIWQIADEKDVQGWFPAISRLERTRCLF